MVIYDGQIIQATLNLGRLMTSWEKNRKGSGL